MPVWVIRGGEDNRWVDAFVDGDYTALGFYEVGDGRTTERWEAIRSVEAGGRHADPAAAVNRFFQFVSVVAVGDPVLMPDAARKEIVVGLIDGDYRFHESVPADHYRHRRPVRWVGRHDRDDLPAAWAGLARQRPAIQRYDALALDQHVAAVVAGELGRPARERGSRTARTTRTARAPAKPKPPARVLRTCPGCGFNLSESVFDGEELCRDCRA